MRALGFGLLVLALASMQRPNVAAAISTASVALLSALMCVAGGAFFGLLFGVPRQNKPDDSGSAIEPNNNLEQVSDWLTKMIVGITLVQFDAIIAKVKVVARQINDAMLGCPPQCADNYAMGLAVIGFFTVIGFLMMFLWSRIYLLEEVNKLRTRIAKDSNALEKLRKENVPVQDKPEDLLKQPAGLLNQTVNFVRTLASSNATVEEAATAAATAPRLAGITEVRPGLHANDPWKGVFGGKSASNGREITAKVTPVSRSEYCSVLLTVRSTDGLKPLQGEVKFFLHDTFPDPVRTVPVENGVATLTAASWGAYTVGVLADGGNTRLELDLSGVPDAPADWRGR